MKRLQELALEPRTLVLYESPYRIVKCLEQIAETMGEQRRVAVVREITKKFEETVRGTVTEAIAHFKAHEPKGEFVIVVAGYDPKAERNAEADEDNEEEE
jgi:16S rRNA (cytidine1402-2'-O)-methyltransferase